MFLLDTNVISELRKGSRADPGVVAWITPIDDADLFLSVVVSGELRQGVERLRLRDAVQAESLDRWLRALNDEYAERVLPVDSRVADLWGRLNAPDPISAVDGLLAATAIVHDLTFVTRNVRDVERTGVRLHNPFRSG
jgi:predicted nucleic acid-binding protein